MKVAVEPVFKITHTMGPHMLALQVTFDRLMSDASTVDSIILFREGRSLIKSSYGSDVIIRVSWVSVHIVCIAFETIMYRHI